MENLIYLVAAIVVICFVFGVAAILSDYVADWERYRFHHPSPKLSDWVRTWRRKT